MRSTPSSSSLRARAWRWHFLAALVVVPFVLWQSITGTFYLWSYAAMDARHPQLRFVSPAREHASLDAQVDAARAALPGSRIVSVVVSADPARSTEVLFDTARDVPAAVFVDPRDARVLGMLDAADWWPGWSRKLHGGWPLGDPGSWLLELGASWALAMVLSGIVLWWPRRGRWWRALLPRIDAGRRVLWRDLHACLGAWSALVVAGFLLTALPWTAFWGGTLLRGLQQRTGQTAPSAAGFAPVMHAPDGARDARVAGLEAMLRDARARGMRGDLLLRFVDGPSAAAVSVRTQSTPANAARFALYDRHDGARVADAGWGDFPFVAKAVATGVDIHEGGFFGRLGPWVNTAFALSLVLLSAAGIAAWWLRRPPGALGVPPAAAAPWPVAARWAIAALALLLPLFALSLALLWLGERAWLWSLEARKTT